MFKPTGANVLLLLMALNFASEGAYAAPISRFRLPGGGSSVPKAPSAAPPKTVDANGNPISFWDHSDDVVESGAGAGEKAGKAAKAGAIGATVAGIVGGGVGAGVVAEQGEGQGLGYDYAG
ncbi:hypothetical protein Daus18300_007613 [Diaporthe australafricana]|uniref:Glycine-zipper-containing OmpA-like membrane domain-containing protein n=1 Tax=Diaporthe australafricana TaxID=127596 RepID=A0ABR3WM51_9PEZI